MDDRLFRGALAGAIGDLPCAIINYVSKDVLHYGKQSWIEMLSYLVFGRPVVTATDWAVATGLSFVVGGTLGALYAWFIMPKPGAGRYYFRGLAFGIDFMFLTYLMANLFKVSTVTAIALETVITTVLAAIAWGLVTAYLMKRWDRVYA